MCILFLCISGRYLTSCVVDCSGVMIHQMEENANMCSSESVARLTWMSNTLCLEVRMLPGPLLPFLGSLVIQPMMMYMR
jgi:hypothetical protein